MRFAYALAAVFFFAAPASQAGLPSHPDHLKPRPAPEPMIAAAAEFELEREWNETIPRRRPIVALRFDHAPSPWDEWSTIFTAGGYGRASDRLTIKRKNDTR